MASFTGTAADETINTVFVSATVVRTVALPSAASDQIDGGGGNDILGGGDGNDHIDGGAGADHIDGEQGADILEGRAGDDMIDGGIGDDLVAAGAGNDFIFLGDGDDEADWTLGEGLDTIEGGNGTDRLYMDGASENEEITFSAAGSSILMTHGLELGTASFTDVESIHYWCGGGIDVFTIDSLAPLGLFEMTLDLSTIENQGLGDEQVDRVTLNTGGEDDVAVVMRTADGLTVAAPGLGPQIDLLATEARDNLTVNLQGGSDVADARNLAADTIVLSMNGGGGDDRMYGGSGNDKLVGGGGIDSTSGGAGDDLHYVDDVSDRVTERDGEGTADRVLAAVSYTLQAGVAVERLTTTSSTSTTAIDLRGNEYVNEVEGNAGVNQLSGGSGDDRLEGFDGDDRLRGGDDDDSMLGGDGNDVMFGEGGQDSLNGGAGADTFTFREGEVGATRGQADRIVDFDQAEGDRINVRQIDADSDTDGDQAFTYLGTDPFTGSVGELRHEVINGQTYVQGDTDGDGAADFYIRLDGTPALALSDFSL